MLAPGTVIGGRYRLVTSIASGGMADVYEAQDERLGRAVAVKILRASDAGLSRRFADEVRTLARLNDPGIVALYDADEYEGHAFFVMELVRGRSLADILTDGPLHARRVATIAASATKGLAQAHAAGIVHRDVKPANLMVTADGSAKLADFGIARMTGTQSDLTQAGTVIGTAAYLSPEQAEGKEISPATDIYSLGLVLIEALTAKRVFEGTATETVVARLTRDPEVPQGLPGNWSEILTAMTARDPLSRPFAETLAPMFTALAADETVAMAPDPGPTAAIGVAGAAGGGAAAATEVLGGGAGGADTQATPPVPDHEVDRRRRNIAIAVAVLVGVLLVGGIAYAIMSGSSTTTTTTTSEAPTTVAVETTTTVPETTTTEHPTTSRTTTTTTTRPTSTTSRTTTTSRATTTTTTTTQSPPTTS